MTDCDYELVEDGAVQRIRWFHAPDCRCSSPSVHDRDCLCESCEEFNEMANSDAASERAGDVIGDLLYKTPRQAAHDRASAPHECQRCGSDEWSYVDYGGCSECRSYEERAAEDEEDKVASWVAWALTTPLGQGLTTFGGAA